MSDKNNPLADSVEKLRHELDNWLEFAVEKGEKAIGAFGLMPPAGPFSPAVDVVETDNDVEVDIDLPGVDPASVEVTLAGNMLTVTGEKSGVITGEGRTTHLKGRASGRFTRSIAMPVPVDQDKVIAESKHGVLQVRLAKLEREKKRQIPIKVASQPTGQ